MPSDAKKLKEARKKEAVKNRNKKKPAQSKPDVDEKESSPSLPPEEPVTNGHVVIENGDPDENESTVDENENERIGGVDGSASEDEVDIEAKMAQIELENTNARSATGVLGSHPSSRDVKIDNCTLLFYGREILTDSLVELNCGRRYGLIGLNGCGKSTLLNAIANYEFPIPSHIDTFLLTHEIAASNKSALQTVIEVDEEKRKLEAEAEELACAHDDESHDKLMDVYHRLDEMDSDTAEVKAAGILHGLGFTNMMMHKKCKDFSGGWRMRIALARALYLKPCLLLLDEPTNHLDLDACVWLEEELKQYERILVVVSHSQDFLNGVCTNIIHMSQKNLTYYGGNYDQFVKTKLELEENQVKKYNKEQDQLASMKDYVARFGHGSAKLARQAQSKEKVMQKMIAGGLTERVVKENVKQFYFFDPGNIPPPVIMVQHVSFRYSDDTPLIYKDLDFGIDLDTRVALVGPNGAGKSTLLKLLACDIMPSDGLIRRHSHVKLGRYHQHLHERLDLELTALEYMMQSYPEVKDVEQMRKIVGRYGLTGREQVCPMKQLSDGQRCRVSFAWLAWQTPHLLLLDEPTNHLDMESIDALAEAINMFEGGMILVSHDFRLVSKVAEEIWVCDKQTIRKWDGDIFSYKEFLRHQIERRMKKANKT